MRTDDIVYDFWWASFERNYSAPLFRIAAEAGGARRLYEMDKKALLSIKGISEGYAEEILKYRRLSDPFEEYERCNKLGIRFIPYYSREYPERLRKTPYHPFAIFVKGQVPDDDRKSVALIGARSCSEYGKKVAEGFGRELALAGVSVVSGMAYGIDGISQYSCLRAGGDSYGILGCGVNICYPEANRRLYELLEEKGGLISEYGLDTKPKACLFPARNRIISALCDLVVVIEAKERSGTSITVDMALEQGKDVAIVPGRIYDPLSTGCLSLWKQGAFPVCGVEDILAILSQTAPVREGGRSEKEKAGARNYETSEGKRKKEEGEGARKREEKKREEKSRERDTLIHKLSSKEQRMLNALDTNPRGIEGLCDETGLSLLEAMDALMELKVKKLAKELGKDSFVRVL
ncbi:MAG: DNA-processing protein DprA [Lachnospiraceae bacterium]|nr:DNA-processing protein DprA [Lachnospiraceae bacterium]